MKVEILESNLEKPKLPVATHLDVMLISDHEVFDRQAVMHR